MSDDMEEEAHITRGQWTKMQRMLEELHDALLGTMEKPGGVLVRIEKIEQRLTSLESIDHDRSAGWKQAVWVVLSVVLSTATVGIINAVSGMHQH